MDSPATSQSTRYEISIEPLTGLITAQHNGTVLASSTGAKVMYETRLPPTIYFPTEDVVVELSEKKRLQTFCPFKGTASYRDIRLSEETLSNAVWSYDDPFPESRALKGHVGFMPNAVTNIDVGDNSLKTETSGNVSGPLVNWLMRDAASLTSPEAFTAALSHKFRDNGIALTRLSVLIWSLHPMIAGKNFVWEKDTDEVTTYAPSYEIYDHPSFMNSPMHHVSAGLGGVRQKLETQSLQKSYPIIDDLRAKGVTDYVAMPIPFSDGQINVLTLATDNPDGFTTAELGLIFECSSVISRFYEVFTQRENAQALLETYVGKRSGARVLGGEIRRGTGDEIDAAILFCDLRNSTKFVEAMSRDDYMTLLNEFFDVTSTIVHENEGEVLKYIGDAVLAVFPAGANYSAACTQVLASAREIVAKLGEQTEGDRPVLECSIGIAYGTVTYGNVGSHERLDFTVIGQAANVAARLCDYGKNAGHKIVASKEVVCSDSAKVDLGLVSLRNVSAQTHVFSIVVP